MQGVGMLQDHQPRRPTGVDGGDESGDAVSDGAPGGEQTAVMMRTILNRNMMRVLNRHRNRDMESRVGTKSPRWPEAKKKRRKKMSCCEGRTRVQRRHHRRGKGGVACLNMCVMSLC
ncbi:unnamed protein product [Camellia sinensis]